VWLQYVLHTDLVGAFIPRLNVHEFKPSKHHRAVWNRFKRYLQGTYVPAPKVKSGGAAPMDTAEMKAGKAASAATPHAVREGCCHVRLALLLALPLLIIDVVKLTDSVISLPHMCQAIIVPLAHAVQAACSSWITSAHPKLVSVD